MKIKAVRVTTLAHNPIACHPDSFKTTCQEMLPENTSTSLMNRSRGSGDQFLPCIDDTTSRPPRFNLPDVTGRSSTISKPQNSSYSLLRVLIGTDHDSLHRAYPSLHPFGVVHWVPVLSNIKTTTGCESNRQLQL